MKKAFIGISAALILTTLVVAIVPAFGQFLACKTGDLCFVTSDLYYYLEVNPATHTFSLYTPAVPVGTPFYSCSGVGAVVVKGVLLVGGKCQTLMIALPNGPPTLSVYSGFLSGGGKIANGPIKVVLVILSKPPLKPVTFILWP
jgi:hypothetical protein